ncbi:MAG: adenosylcobinamide amidohydrolase [Desulfarculus sp.]|nr:MAG: adenosylcobinamide amidohydrolase [Desulfarculus sp.]
MFRPPIIRPRLALLLSALLLAALAVPAQAQISFRDHDGRQVSLAQTPQRVVSLVPEVSEAIWALGAGALLKGATIHSAPPAGAPQPALVGGYYAPSLEAILRLQPDLVFIGGPHQAIQKALAGRHIPTASLQARRLADLHGRLAALGLIFGRQEQARRLSQEIKEQLALIAQKTALIPAAQRRRVLRIMSVNAQAGYVSVPGDDSFQNDLIRAAGGLPPRLGQTTSLVRLNLAQWQKLDPQTVYVCGPKAKTLAFLSRPGWRQVEAVRAGRVFSFPCELTCQVSVHSGRFVQWLSAWVYSDYFEQKAYQVRPWRVVRQRPLNLGLDYVQKASVFGEDIQDFRHRTLLIELKGPQAALSTLEGQRAGIMAVGNHYFPPAAWRLGHQGGLASLRDRVLGVLGRRATDTGLLFTGADMQNLSLQRAAADGLVVCALVTAGARSNAQRAAADSGDFLEPGTINIILLTNRRLAPRAMARAIITATEAKTAALQDLDVRSSYQPLLAQATGTGTDNVLVLEGAGPPARLSGGHSKLGELMAWAVYAGVREALLKQNRLRPGRSVFARLEERRVSLYALLAAPASAGQDCPASLGVSMGRLEEILLQPRYAALIEAALSLSDAAQRGQVAELSAFQAWCEQAARELAGRNPLAPPLTLGGEALPPPLALALEALLRGLASQPLPLIPISGPDCGS